MIRRKYSKNNLNITFFLIKIYRIEETETFLNMLQCKLISEKKNLSQHQELQKISQGKLISEKKGIYQHQEIQKIPKSYPYSSFSRWDLVLRKYKKCI